MTPSLKLLAFDFDGTLCDSAATIIQLMQQACRDCGLAIPSKNLIRQNIGQGLEPAAHLYAAGDHAQATALASRYRRLSHDAYHQATPPLDPLFDGAKSCLEAAQKAGYVTALLTNKGRASLASLVQRHGLTSFIDLSVNADDAPAKPAPDMAYMAMDHFGILPANMLLIGDTEIDAGCAQNASIGFIGVGWGYHSPSRLRQAGALEILAHYTDLLPLADRILGK